MNKQLGDKGQIFLTEEFQSINVERTWEIEPLMSAKISGQTLRRNRTVA